jgi:hypothetical protein
VKSFNRVQYLTLLNPFIFSLYTPLTLINQNPGDINGLAPILSIAKIILYTALLYIFAAIIFKDIFRASISTSIIISLALGYGEIHDQTVLLFPELSNLLLHVILLLSCIIAIGLLILALKKAVNLHFISVLLLMIAFFSIFSPLREIMSYSTMSRELEIIESCPDGAIAQSGSSPIERLNRDIYFIVLDGYGREDMLKEIYQFDNSSFTHALENMGFIVGDESSSPYPITIFSIASTLNMHYIHETLDHELKGSLYANELARRIAQNCFVEQINLFGYKTIALESGYPYTEVDGWDRFQSPPDGKSFFSPTPLGALIAERSIISFLYELNTQFGTSFFNRHTQRLAEIHRDRILYQWETMVKEISTDPEATFVFAHNLAPHPPFVFSRSEDASPVAQSFSLNDGNRYRGTTEEYINGYREQVDVLNETIINKLDEILAQPGPEPIIILMGDHGPGAFTNWDQIQTSNIYERFSILYALYLPEIDQLAGPEIPAPVNTFRYILNSYYGYEYPLLEEQNFLGSIVNIKEMSEITTELNDAELSQP